MDLNKLKLVIWDLDDTFWQGTLSEGEVRLKPQLCQLVRQLVDRGVMCSICSKNDLQPVRDALEKADLWQYFVFPSIDWTPKAPRIAHIIQTMALREVNVLFIDDNPVNLNEARFYLPKLNVMHIDDIDPLLEQAPLIGKDDSSHSRLAQYRVMERKVSERQSYHSTSDFLVQSRIRVDIKPLTAALLDRVVEMIGRTNQLNYTKLRSTPGEVAGLLGDPQHECAVVSVSDRYGDYGIVGFYALHRPSKTLTHFLFSCRTLGMGIEQYVYEQLKFPRLQVVGEVANAVEPRAITHWINLKTADDTTDNTTAASTDDAPRHRYRVLLKGPCDMRSTELYLNAQRAIDIHTEFNYVNRQGIAISAMNHSSHIVQAHKLSEAELQELLADVPFMDQGVFRQQMLQDEPWDFVFMSMLTDCHEGVYRHRTTGHVITFSSFVYDITDPSTWPQVISGAYPNHNFAFTEAILRRFSERFTFEGHLSPQQIVDNVRYIREQILPAKTLLVLILGSEVEFETPTPGAFADHAPVHRAVNRLLQQAFKDDNRVRFINFTDFITSQSDFHKCTNHFSRGVYYQMANRICSLVNEQANLPAVKTDPMLLTLIKLPWRKLRQSIRKRRMRR